MRCLISFITVGILRPLSSGCTCIPSTSPYPKGCRLRAGVTVLVDPWLVGQLTFGGLSWVYAGNKKGPKLDPKAIAAGADFMLITQVANVQ